jgi:hypothetical protein
MKALGRFKTFEAVPSWLTEARPRPLTQALPAQISRALYPADRVLTGTARPLVATDWTSAYQALISGTEELG